jgi:hypothetical protein
VFPECETRLYHCSFPHYPSQGTFLRSIVLVISVHCAPNVQCVTTSAHCVGVHHVAINARHVVNVHHVGAYHVVANVHCVMLVFIMLLLVFIVLCWCSSCCFPPFYGWYYPYLCIVLQIKVLFFEFLKNHYEFT